MSNKKQTAVEYLLDQLDKKFAFKLVMSEILEDEDKTEYYDLIDEAKAMGKEQKQKLETCLRHCLLMLVQTKAHREMLNLTGGDIFLDSTIEEIKELINYEL